MHWVYLSPHFDDIALSCGGLVWEQTHSGDRVEIWTVCAGDPLNIQLSHFAQELHERWKTGTEAVADRRQEDMRADLILGAAYRYFNWPDCIYRFRHDNGQPVICGEYDLFHASPEENLVSDLTVLLKKTVPKGARLVCPMALGDHIDHHFTRLSAERSGMPLIYYPDYPYILNLPAILEKMEHSYSDPAVIIGINSPSILPPGHADLAKAWARLPMALSTEALKAWQSAIAAYHSQISTFWTGLPEMELAINNYWAGGGWRLWQIK